MFGIREVSRVTRRIQVIAVNLRNHAPKPAIATGEVMGVSIWAKINLDAHVEALLPLMCDYDEV